MVVQKINKSNTFKLICMAALGFNQRNSISNRNEKNVGKIERITASENKSQSKQDDDVESLYSHKAQFVCSKESKYTLNT